MKIKRKIPNYEDKILTLDELIKLKKRQWLIAKGIIKSVKGGKNK